MAKLKDYSDEQLRLAARLYYVDGLGQREVARLAKVSQAKVSRLLAAARERGIVHISVAEYKPHNKKLEHALRREFGFRTVAVIKTPPGATDDDARRAVGYFGASVVAGLLPRKAVVAIAGGRTIRDLVRHLAEDPARRLEVVQAMGNIDSHVGSEDALELGRVLARRSGGSFVTLNSPAFVSDRKTRDAFLALPPIRSVHQRLAEAQVALVGVGTLDNSVFAARGVLTPRDIAGLDACGAVGEICGRFFDRNGQECDSPWRDRVVSISLEQLRRIPRVIGIVAGGDRSVAITAAARGGLLKALVTEEKLGQFLFAAARASISPASESLSPGV